MTGPTRPAATGSAEPDYAELERLARAATPGPWRGTTIGNYDQRHAAAAAFEAVMARRLPDSPDVEFSDLSWVLTADESLNVALVGNGANGPENAAYIAAASPDVVLRLLARRAPGDREREALRETRAALARIAHSQESDLSVYAKFAETVAREALEATRALAADSRPEQPRPSPRELWQQADGDTHRYLELMLAHGHLIPGKREPGTDIFGHPVRPEQRERTDG